MSNANIVVQFGRESAMEEKVIPPSEKDQVHLEEMRNWLRSHFHEGEREKYDKIEGKLFVVQSIVKNNWFDRNESWQLQALGVGFGDAIAQKIGMAWVVVETGNERMPMLQFPGTSLKLAAFTMIQKRVLGGEDIDVFSLFDALCQRVEEIKAPKRSLLGRLFGPRLT
jgi:hypothetical protein